VQHTLKQGLALLKGKKKAIMTQPPPIRLLYADTRFNNEQLIQFIETAWEEIYELEYDRVYGGWRGVHYQEETSEVYVTWDNSYGGPPLCVKIQIETGEKRLGHPLPEQIDREMSNLGKLQELADKV